MRFSIVRSHSERLQSDLSDHTFLLKESWNDWFKYETLFALWYRDAKFEFHFVGRLKIGQLKMQQASPSLQSEFEKLKDDYFSVGQDENYYLRLNELGKKVRNQILKALRDFAKTPSIYEKAKDEDVTKRSLLRSVTEPSILGHFKRLAGGGARVTEYEFQYRLGSKSSGLQLDFNVEPESTPPSNIHVLIGANGVGKTRLLKSMVQSLTNPKYTEGKFVHYQTSFPQVFANVVYVSFSAFDVSPTIAENKGMTPYTYVGLKATANVHKTIEELTSDFVASLIEVLANDAKRERWSQCINILESDSQIANLKLKLFAKQKFPNKKGAINERKIIFSNVFNNLSSGQKMVLLTVTRLTELVEETSLVLMDEPEGHLHPPLLSDLIRCISHLLINRNAVAIISTHSPVVLQEVPRRCVWRIRRSGNISKAERLNVESFGENVGILTQDAFGLEVTNSGYHIILQELTKRNEEYNVILKKLNGELGLEGKSILMALTKGKKK